MKLFCKRVDILKKGWQNPQKSNLVFVFEPSLFMDIIMKNKSVQ